MISNTSPGPNYQVSFTVIKVLELCPVLCNSNSILYYVFLGINSCSVDNGGCSHLCIPVPGGRVCACPDLPRGPVNTTDGYNCEGGTHLLNS